MKEIYFSIDIETDGPIPENNSMLSCALVPCTRNEIIDDGISVNFELLPNAIQDKETMNFWSKYKKEYEATRNNLLNPVEGIKLLNEYIIKTSDKLQPVIIGYPVFFDYMFFYWYQIKFTNYSPTSFSALDIKTLASEKLQIPYKMSTKRNFPKHWFDPNKKHTHIALDDAYEQAYMFIKMNEKEK